MTLSKFGHPLINLIESREGLSLIWKLLSEPKSFYFEKNNFSPLELNSLLYKFFNYSEPYN